MVSSKFVKDNTILDTSYIEIEIDSNNRLFDYKVSSSTNEGIYCGYNYKLNALDFYDLNKRKQIFQSKLESNNLNKIGPVSGCYIVNIDSVFLLTEKKIVLVNKLGKIQREIRINSFSEVSYFKNNYVIEFDRTKNFSYDSSKKRIFATSVSAKGMDRKDSYENSPVTVINLGNKTEFKNAPVSWSNLYKDDFYGFLSTLFISLEKDKIILSFPVEPNIYVFNEKTRKTVILGGYPDLKNIKSLIAEPLNEEFRYDDDKKLMHYLTNIIYGKVISDIRRKMYYRVINLGLDGGNEGVQNFDKRKSFLTVYNENFEIIKTLSLNDQRYIEDGAFDTEMGLLIPCPHRASSLRFKVFKFKKN